MKEFSKDRLKVKAFDTDVEMGRVAAADVAACIGKMLETREELNMIFAAAPSQNTFLAALVKEDVQWNRINAFHMDEYIGLQADAPQGFGNFLDRGLFSLVPFKSVNKIDCSAADVDAECARYSALLAAHPVDIVCLGIGENAHIAFNDPWVADFNDPVAVKPVPLDEVCRQQQVNDGCFASIDLVPKTAITLTVPSLTRAAHMFCMVPYATKAVAVRNVLNEEVSEKYPATVLRKHADATLYIDAQSSKLL